MSRQRRLAETKFEPRNLQARDGRVFGWVEIEYWDMQIPWVVDLVDLRVECSCILP
jgi:hypothetical protein